MRAGGSPAASLNSRMAVMRACRWDMRHSREDRGDLLLAPGGDLLHDPPPVVGQPQQGLPAVLRIHLALQQAA